MSLSPINPLSVSRLLKLNPSTPPVSQLLNHVQPSPLQGLGELVPPDQLQKVVQNSQSNPTVSQPHLMASDPAKPTINPDSRVLHFGDSHTVGIYGREMDKHLRSTGAKVETYGSAGSSPSWWINGTTTRSGYYAKNEEERVDSPKDWRTPRKTPKLPDLIEKFKPNVIVISLGANMIRNSGENIQKQVHDIAKIAQESGAKIIWVGPPDGRESKKPTSKQDYLYDNLQQAASQYGTFIDSRPKTEYPASGGDGLHYWGKEGSRIAKEWASSVFEEIQDSP